MLRNIAKIREHKNIIIVGVVLTAILVDGGFFPIVNFNPDNPVNLGIVMHLMIIVMAVTFHKEIGSLEAVIFPEWSMPFISIFNVALVLGGLGCRYLLEFGEVSNTYNFTVVNVLFQVLALASISTVVCVLVKKKSLEER